MLGFGGVTPTETRVAAVTVNVIDPDTLPRAAVIVVEPSLPAVASPCEPTALLTAAAVVLEELQATAAVRFCVE